MDILIQISELWAKYQGGEINGDEFAIKVSRLLPDDIIGDAWTAYNRKIILSNDKNSLEILTLNLR